MATYSTVAIVNTALLLCGASSITALTDNTPNARAANAVYEIARKNILTECRWTFATTRSSLVTVATSVIAWLHSEESQVYTRPSIAIKIWEMSDPYAVWREEGNYIIADSNGLGAKYAWDQSDVSVWPPEFVAAFIDKLCTDISYMIINSATKAQAFYEKYEKISLPKAMSANSQVGSYKSAIDDYWEGAKLSNGGNAAKSYS